MAKIPAQTWTFGVIGVLLIVAVYLYMRCAKGKKESFSARSTVPSNLAPYRRPSSMAAEPFISYKKRKENFEAMKESDKNEPKSQPASYEAASMPDMEGNAALLPQGDKTGVRIPGVIEDGVLKIEADVTRYFTMNPPRRNMNRSIRKDPEITIDPDDLKNYNQSSITENPFNTGFELKSTHYV